MGQLSYTFYSVLTFKYLLNLIYNLCREYKFFKLKFPLNECIVSKKNKGSLNT